MTAPAAPSRWLAGPLWDLLLGCGGLYVCVFALLTVAGPQIRSLAPEGLLPLGALLLGAPHYGATLLRVYQKRSDVQRYRVFSVYLTALVFVVFVIGAYDITVGSWMLTLYLTWSPWHYSGQNYGIALLFLHRRGVRVTPLAKRLVYATFLLSWIMVVLSIHASTPSANYAPISLTSSAYTFIPLGLPPEIAALLMFVAAGGYIGTWIGALVLLRREGSFRDMSPALLLMALQALWFFVPVLARSLANVEGITSLSIRDSSYALTWVAYAHFIQYLWITTCYARSSHSEARNAPYWGKVLLAGAAIWGVPALLFSPAALGRIPFDAGLAALVASAVNIHHFILDGAIWKLRDGRIARVLLRSPEPEDIEPAPRQRPWIPSLIWAVGIACVVIEGVGILELEYGFRRATPRLDAERLQEASDRLRWIGREHRALLAQLAIFAAREGDLAEAELRIERSLGLYPTAEAWAILGDVRRRAGGDEAALAAYDHALSMDPNEVDALDGSARIWRKRGEFSRARDAWGRAVELAPDRLDIRRRLARAWVALGDERRRDGRDEAALAAYDRALSMDPDAVDALDGSARIWRERGELTRARDAWERAAELAPDRMDIRRRLGRVGGDPARL